MRLEERHRHRPLCAIDTSARRRSALEAIAAHALSDVLAVVGATMLAQG
jgi:hypothetical protein